MDVRLRELPTIGGGGGGGKFGGSNDTSGGEEAPNSLKSKQTARVIDLLSEGPIFGIVDPQGNLSTPKGTYFDGVVVQRPNGQWNFTGAKMQFRRGDPAQARMDGFPAAEAEEAVGVELKRSFPIIRNLINTDADRTRITVSVPALQDIDKDSGDINGTSVRFRIEINNNGGGWVNKGEKTITGKTTSNYQRAYTMDLPRPGPWDIRLTRLTADSTTTTLQNQLFWDSFTAIIDDRVNYSHSACVGIIINAEQFRTIPKRVYDVMGLLIRYPNNMDPEKGTYSGPWDGTFAFGWCNNPAWVLYDIITNKRYGLGYFVTDAMIDRYTFYKAGVWCDQRVPGKNGNERRYTCNIRITSQQEAFDLLAQLASVFRAFTYWTGGKLLIDADQPEDPTDQFTNANVIDGTFNYSGTDVRERHNQAQVAWQDPDQMGETRLATVEPEDAAELIGRYGLRISQEAAFGCTAEGQAVRAGKWTLYTEQYESDNVQFRTGLIGAYVRPGSIAKIMDANVAGHRRGGRCGEGSTTTTIVFDSPIEVVAGRTYVVSTVIIQAETSVIQTREAVASVTGPVSSLNVSSAFSRAPEPDHVFVVTEPTLEATLWRVMATRQADTDTYEIEAVRHYPQKWNVVERNHSFSDPTVTDISPKPDAVTNAKVVEYITQTSAISLQVMATFSWTSKAPLFDVFWHRTDENWQHIRTDQQAVDLAVSDGDYEFQVTPIGTLGIKGPMTSIKQTIIGLTALPGAPRQFRINVLDAVATFDWLPAPELDVIVGGHYELRFSTQTSGATWNTAQTVIPSIPGNATSVEAGYQIGTWLLRTFDITGRASEDWAAVIALAADTRYTQVYRVCENPDFLGTKAGTEILLPQQWLVIGQTGGLWDWQTDNMDSWPDVDVLPIPAGFPPPEPEGLYYFANRLDAGTPISVRLSVDLLAFPFYENDENVDSRLTPVDEWEDWDDAQGDLDGSVTILIRSTNEDPASPAAVWTPWKNFIPGEHFGRGFEFGSLSKASVGQNIGIETMCIVGDFRNKVDRGSDVPYPAAITQINFNIKFYTVPAVVVTVQEALSTDQIQIVDKTREFFKISITNGGVQQTRTFDWHSIGY